jgi:hypothetical protein
MGGDRAGGRAPEEEEAEEHQDDHGHEQQRASLYVIRCDHDEGGEIMTGVG